jgi:hypothetical protein
MEVPPPAAGLGTRFPRLTKQWQDEVLSPVDRPAIHRVVGEAIISVAENLPTSSKRSAPHWAASAASSGGSQFEQSPNRPGIAEPLSSRRTQQNFKPIEGLF